MHEAYFDNDIIFIFLWALSLIITQSFFAKTKIFVTLPWGLGKPVI